MMSETVGPADLAPTGFLDADHPLVHDFAHDVVVGAQSDAERASRLFAAVRDEIRYDPYVLDIRPQHMRASAVLASGRNWCVPKATLLVAACRAVGVPARPGYADVRNHLSSKRLEALMGTDIFVWHGYVSLHANGRWWKVSPAFNQELCERFGVPPLEFDGSADALLHAYDGEGRRHMEYLVDHGTFDDLPLARIVAALRSHYPVMAANLEWQRDEAFHG